MAMIYSSHYEPRGNIRFFDYFTFLKKGGLIIFHDVGKQKTRSKHSRLEWAPFIIFNIIINEKNIYFVEIIF